MADEVSILSEKLLLDARVIALQLDSICIRDSVRGDELRQQLMDILSGEILRSRPASSGPRTAPDEVESLIHEFLVESDEPQSVELIYQFVQGFVVDIRKPSLNVKLHRMATTGAIMKAHHGHYTVSELERRRAKTGGR